MVACGHFVSCSGALGDVACPTAALCVAPDGIGDVLTTTTPTGGAAAWAKSDILGPIKDGDAYGGPPGPNHVTCASASLCFLFGHGRYVYTSTDPAGGARA